MAGRREPGRWGLPVGLRFTLVLSLVPLLVLPLIGLRFVEIMVELARNERLENLDMAARILSLPLHERPELFIAPDAARSGEAVRMLTVGTLPQVEVDQKPDEWTTVPGQEFVDVGSSLAADELEHATIRAARSVAKPDAIYLLVHVDDEQFVRPEMRTGIRLPGDELVLSFGDRAAEMRETRIQPVARPGGWLAEVELDPEPQLLRVRIVDIDRRGSKRTEVVMDSGLLAPARSNDDARTRDSRLVMWESASHSLERATGRVSVYDAAGDLLARSGELVTGGAYDESWEARLARWLLRVADALRPAVPEAAVDRDAPTSPPAAADGATVVTGVAGAAPPPRATPSSAERTNPPATTAVAEKAATVSTLTRALSGLPAHSARRIEAESGVPSWLLSSAHPVWVGDRVVGALTIEENSASRLVFGQRAIERLTLLASVALLASTLALLLVGSVTVWRIVRLRREAESAIDPRGRVVGDISPSKIRDEIGALAGSYASVLERLGQHQQYLANLRSRLVHELRTPIMVVRSSLDNLAAEADESLRAGYLDRVRDGAQRLERILSSMSEASSLESMLADGELENVSLAQLVEGCAEGYRSAFAREFVVERGASEAWCMVAPDAIAQALDKLVTNAVDFARPDTPIRIRLGRAGERRAAWRISVMNEGPPLPPKMGELLFDSMVSVRTRGTGRAAHLGMGLYMVRLIAEFHGGRAYARDVPGGVEVGLTIVDRG